MMQLPLEFVDTKNIPLSRMQALVEYPIFYDSLTLDKNDAFWVRRDASLSLCLDEYESENDQVYLSRSEGGDFTVRIPSSFSKRRKWARHDFVDINKCRIVKEILVD